MIHNRPAATTWSSVTRIRPASLTACLDERSRHWASLGGLDTEIAAAEERRSDADVSALRRRLAEWVRHENTLDAVGAGLIFRLYWDDLGGES